MQRRKPPLPALTVKRSIYNVDDVAVGGCKTGAEEAGVTEVRTNLTEKKFELWREIKVGNMIKLLSRKPTALRLVNPSAAKIKIFTASALRSEERFSRNAETDLVCRLLLEKKKQAPQPPAARFKRCHPFRFGADGPLQV